MVLQADRSAEAYTLLDAWETMKAHVTDLAPALAAKITVESLEAWREITIPEAQVLAIMVGLDLDIDSPAMRRKARAFLREISHEGDSSGTGIKVREGCRDFDGRVTEKQRDSLAATIRWIAQSPPAVSLSRVAGPIAAAKLVSRHCPALRNVRAWRWLAAIGYPSPVPDAARQRFLQRFGWLEEAKQTVAGRNEAARRLEELARDTSSDVRQFSVIIGAFAGSGPESTRDAARCLPTPRCPDCPLAEQCTYYRHNRGLVHRENRSLATSMRREQRPREKLVARGPQSLSDEELLAILLRTGNSRHNAVDLANQILKQAESVERLSAMSVEELSKFHGMGMVKAVTVKAALELGRRTQEEGSGLVGRKLNGARRVFEYMRPFYAGARQEQFVALLLNTKLELMRRVVVTTGTLNQSLVHPREAFSEAVRDVAHGVIFVHNHPSGDPAPSRDDKVVTKRLARAGDHLGIQVLDHVIIGTNEYYSFTDEGELNS